MRAAETHRNSETLSGADGDVGTQRTRGSGEYARQQVGGHDDYGASGVCLIDRRSPIWHRAGRCWQAEQHAEAVLSDERTLVVGNDDL
ncbi:unannotated protein [freshwater metagenome]|uniref:Unannotated protein n=1 Tax=freshwater metagenome TaxID=449393 RepID=A0A6J7Q4D1_9ZZZZ